MAEATKTSVEGRANGRQRSVADRVGELRERAQADRDGVRDEVWDWFADGGRSLREDSGAAAAELDALFRYGRPLDGLDGQTEGMLVAWTWHPLPNRLLNAVTDRWLPWQGKRFDAANNSGDNVLTRDARWPAKLVWPLYSTRPAGESRIAFEFETYVEPGKLDPGTDVLVIDYARVEENPRLIIKAIRDELVEVVPGANLGKMLYRWRGDHYNLAYFALRS